MRARDTHVHVFGPTERFAFAAGRLPPAEAPKEARFFALHRRLGIERA